MSIRFTPLVMFLAAVSPSIVLGQASLTVIGPLPTGMNTTGVGVSADGTVVAGNGNINGNVNTLRAFRWTQAGGIVVGTPLGTGTQMTAGGLSADGSTIVGSSFTTSSGSSVRAFRWTLAGGVENLGVVFASGTSGANATNADGSVITGMTSTSATVRKPFRWTAAGGMVGLPTLQQFGNQTGYGVSADGNVIAGDWGSPTGLRATRWTQAGSYVFCPETQFAAARGISGDGNVVIGAIASTVDPINHAAIWRWSDGVILDLGILPEPRTQSSATATTFDGSIVVGSSYWGVQQQPAAILWSQSLGMVDLNVFAAQRGANLAGLALEQANAISPDGRFIVGTARISGATRAFLLDLGPVCGADFNHDYTNDFFDYLDFVDAFAASNMSSDFNRDSSIDFFDYLDFVDAYSSC